jgi:hypothetical protein
MSPEVQAIVFLLIFYTGFLVFGVASFFYIRMHIKKFMAISKNNKEFRRREKERHEMLERGDLHDWKEYDYFGNGKMMLRICSKTGWCPESKSYFPLEALRALDRIKEQEKEKAEFRDKRMDELSQKYELPRHKMEEISEDIFKIKKDWHLLLMDRTKKEMEAKIKKIEAELNGKQNKL